MTLLTTGIIIETRNGGSAWRILPATRVGYKPHHVQLESLSTQKHEYVHSAWLRKQLERGLLKIRA